MLPPYMSIPLSWILYTIPGFLFSYVIVKRLHWVERIPLAFVLSTGLATPITILAIVIKSRLNLFLTLLAGLAIIIIGIFIFDHFYHKKNQKEDKSNPIIQPERLAGVGPALILLICFLGGYLAFLASQWPPEGDDLAGMAGFAEVLRLGKITGIEPFHGTETSSTPRNELVVWSYLEMIICKVSGTTPPEFFVFSRPVFIILGFLAFYTINHQFFKKQNFALLTTSIWCVYLISQMQLDSTGNDLVTRIFQDKFFGWFVVVPIVLTLMLWFLSGQRWLHLLGFSVATFGATLIHPITLTQVMILGGGFGFVYFLFQRSKRTIFSLFLLLIVILICLVVPIYEYIQYSGLTPIEAAGLSDAVEFGRISMAVGRGRLWLLEGGKYILHPSIILQPVILLAYALLPLLIFRLKKDAGTQLIVGSMIVMPIVFYVPPLAMLAGKFVTPYLMWRLAWPFHAVAIISISIVAMMIISGLSGLVDRLSKRGAFVFQQILIIVPIFIAIVLARPDINFGLSGFQERLVSAKYSVCASARAVLAYLDHIAYDHYVDVLASSSLNYCIPGFAPLANVVDFRGYGTVNRLPIELITDSLQRVADVDYFTTATKIDDQIIATIQRYHIDYILVEKDNLLLDMQLKYLPSLFTPIFTDQNYGLYAVAKPLPGSLITRGNTEIQSQQWIEADATFTSIIQSTSDKILAYLGLAEAKERQGDLTSSLNALQYATNLAPQEPAVHARLADEYLLAHDISKAIEEYQIAISLESYSSSLYVSLASAYAITGDQVEALTNNEKASELQTPPNTASRYQNIGDLFALEKNPNQAIIYYQKANSILPDPTIYLGLSQQYFALNEISQSIDAANQAIQMDEWFDLSHKQLGSIYFSEGQYDKAVAEYEISWRLNPSSTTIFSSLATAIYEAKGIDAAILRLEDLNTINRILPGPHKALASLYSINGNYDRAVQELNIVAGILPRDATVPTSLGDLYRETGELAAAQEAYDQALVINPELISARSGLGFIYNQNGQVGLQIGQLYYIERAIPLTAWPHLTLAGLFQGIDDLITAEEEIGWALSLEPNNSAVYVTYGNLSTFIGKLDQAGMLYRKSIEIDPSIADGYVSLASLYEGMGEKEAAKLILDKAISLGIQDINLSNAIASYYLSQNDYQESIRQYQHSIQLAPDVVDTYIQLSDVYLQMNQIEAAKTTLIDSFQKVSDPSSAFNQLAQIELLQGNDQAVIDWLTENVKNSPNASDAYINLANEYERRGDLNNALYYLQQAVVKDPESSPAYGQIASLLLSQGQYKSAEKVFQAWSSVFPYSSSPLIGLANLYIKQGNLDGAEAYYRKALSIVPITSDIFNGLSEVYQLRGDWNSALEILQLGIQTIPTQAAEYRNMATLDRMMGRYDQSEEMYRSAIRVDAADTDSYLGLSQLYLRKGEAYTAEMLLKKAVEGTIGSSTARLNLASFYETVGDLTKAEEQYKLICTLFPTSSNYQSLGQYYQRQNRHNDALLEFQQALTIPPNSAYLYVLIGNSYLALYQPEEALSAYQQGKDANHTDPNPYIWLSLYYQSRENWIEAINTLQEGISVQPTNLNLHISLGSLYQRLGRYQDASNEYNNACAVDRSLPDCEISLGYLYKTTQQTDLAIQHFTKALQLDPTQLSAYSGLATIYQLLGDQLKSVQSYTDAINQSSDQFGALVTRAAYYQTYGEWDKAQADLEKAWQLYPYSLSAGGQLATFYLSHGDYEMALDLRRSLTLLPSASAQNYIDLGKVFETTGDWEVALTIYLQALEINNKYSNIYLSIANVYNQLGKRDEALQAYITAADVDDQNPSVFLSLGDAYLARLDYQNAEAAYNRALMLSPTLNINALVKLDNLSLKQGKGGIDLSPIIKKANITPNAGNCITLGYQYQLRGDWGSARQWYQKAVTLEPYNSSAWLSLGNYYKLQREWDLALNAYNTGLVYAPYSSDILLAKGSVLEVLQQTDEALGIYQLVIQSYPNLISGYISQGNLQAGQSQTDAAISILNQGLEAVPAGIGGYQALGTIYVSNNNPTMANETYQNGLKLVPGSATLYTSLASIDKTDVLAAQQTLSVAEAIYKYWEYRVSTAPTSQQRQSAQGSLSEAQLAYQTAQSQLASAQSTSQSAMGEYEAAKKAYEQALSLQPDNVDAWLGLGQLSNSLGDTEQAIVYYEQAVKLNPTSVAALNALGYAYLDQNRAQEALDLFNKSLLYSPFNLGAQFGLIRVYTSTGQYDALSAAISASFSQHWWSNFIIYFREREPQ